MTTFDLIQNWYDRTDVKYEIVKQTMNRETVCLIPSWVTNKNFLKKSTRMLKMHCVAHFDVIYNRLKINQLNIPFNFYYSLAEYWGGIPNQSLNFGSEERKRNNRAWNYTHTSHIKGFDFMLDIDAGDHKDIFFAWKSAINIQKFFNDCHCPHFVRFSGKGFHIIIPHKYLPTISYDITDKKNNYIFYSMIARALSERFSEMIDRSIYDSRRVAKLSYSLSLYDNQAYVCYPFNGFYELNNFDLENFKLENFTKDIYRRGHIISNVSCSPNHLFKKLGIDDYLRAEHGKA